MKYTFIKSSLSILLLATLSIQVKANSVLSHQIQKVEISDSTLVVSEEIGDLAKNDSVDVIAPEEPLLSDEVSEETQSQCHKYIDHLNKQAEKIIKKNKLNPEAEKKVRQVLQVSIKNLIHEMYKLKEERRIIMTKMSSGKAKEVMKSFSHIYKRDEEAKKKIVNIQAKVSR